MAAAAATAITAAVKVWQVLSRPRRERLQEERRREERERIQRREQAGRDLAPLADIQQALPRLRECAESSAREPSPDIRRRQLRKCAEDIRLIAGSTRHRDVRQAIELAANRCEAWVPVENEETIAGFLAGCDDYIRKADLLIRERLQEVHDIASGELD